MDLKLERQYPTKVSEADPSHAARYHFAASRITYEEKILDAACGVGYGSEILSRKASVTGIDIDREAIEHARKHFPSSQYINDDVMNVDGKYDVIVSFETIEHIPDDVGLVKKFREIGRKLICSVPNEHLYKFYPEVFKHDTYPHLRHYTPDEFETLLTEAGWTVMGKYYQEDKFNPRVREGTNGRFLVYTAI